MLSALFVQLAVNTFICNSITNTVHWSLSGQYAYLSICFYGSALGLMVPKPYKNFRLRIAYMFKLTGPPMRVSNICRCSQVWVGTCESATACLFLSFFLSSCDFRVYIELLRI